MVSSISRHWRACSPGCPLPALRTQIDAPLLGMKHHIPRYTCWRGWLDNGEPRCIAFGGLRVDDAIEEALLQVVEPGAIAAAVEAEAQAADRRDQVRDALMRDLEAARYTADRAFRQYDAADPAEPTCRGGAGGAVEQGTDTCRRDRDQDCRA